MICEPLYSLSYNKKYRIIKGEKNKMKCQSCGGEMEFSYPRSHGRHYREIYLCKECKRIKDVKIGVIPNQIRKRSIR